MTPPGRGLWRPALACLLLSACSPRPWAAPGARGAEAEIYRSWVKYLDSKDGQFSRNAGTPSPYWLASEQQQWRAYDLAALYLPDGARPEVLSIAAEPEPSGEYRVVTLFHAPDENNSLRSREVRLTVFAVPTDSGWRFGNALPRLTREWRRDTVGSITYVIEPGYPYSRARGGQAAAFVDSLARALGVPPPEHLTYYLDSTEDEITRTLGLETDTKWGAVGGLGQPINGQLFSGIPALGENYRHELTHLVILPLVLGHATPYLISEGVPTWLGGTTGMDFPTAARGLAGFLSQHPELTLDSLMTGHFPVAQFYPAGAVFVDMTFRHGGTAAVKTLFDAGFSPEQFHATAERIYRKRWAEIAADWRTHALSFQAGPDEH